MAEFVREEFDRRLREQLRPTPAPPAAWTAEHLQGKDNARARVIAQDIYNRHGIPADTPFEEAAALIEQQAQERNVQPPGGVMAWNSPEDRGRAREEYAAQGRTAGDVRRRWGESVYLIPPDARDYYQNYVRDIDFLSDVGRAGQRAAGGTADRTGNEAIAMMGASMAAADSPSQGYDERRLLTGANLDSALRYWDSSNNSPLYRRNYRTGTYGRHGGVGNAMVNATTNPDVPAGAAMENLEQFLPNRVRFAIAGSSDVGADARAWSQLAERNRAAQPVKVLDLPAGATAEQKQSRVGSLMDQIAELEPPMVRHSIYNRTGFDVGPVGGAIAEGVTSALDGTQALPLLGLLKGGGMASLGAIGRGMAQDTAFDAATTGSLSAGMTVPMTQESWAPGFKKPADLPQSSVSAEQRAAMRDEQSKKYDAGDSQGVSRADSDAYSRLIQRRPDLVPKGPRYR